jgi:predicted GNAT superfamily acetyltransferase
MPPLGVLEARHVAHTTPGSAPIPRRPPPDAALVAEAITQADGAAAAAGVVVRESVDRAEFATICELFREVWSEDPDDPAITPALLQALSYAGNYVAVAAQSGHIVGACVGFHGIGAAGWDLHSHIAGVARRARGRSVGFAMKTHQRAWALRHGIETITWTFDPLVRRNAYFNLTKLGARSRVYLENFYGRMSDGINRGDETDRLLVEWRLSDERVRRACAGQPADVSVDTLRAVGAALGLSADPGGRPVRGNTTASTVLVEVPADIEGLRTAGSSSATQWRQSLREVLGGLLHEGATVTGFAAPGWYVVEADR